MTWTASFYYVFFYLVCFVVRKYVSDGIRTIAPVQKCPLVRVRVSFRVGRRGVSFLGDNCPRTVRDIYLTNSTTYLLTRLQKKFISCEPKEL